MKPPSGNDPRQTLIRLLAAQAVKDYLQRKPQQARGSTSKCTNRVVQNNKNSA